MNWFYNLPVESQLAIIFSIAIVVIVFLYLGFRFRFKFSNRKLNVSMGDNSSTHTPSPHAGCQHAPDIRLSLLSLWDIFKDWAEYKFAIAIYRQEDAANSHINQLQDEYMRIYASLLSDKGIKNPVSSQSYKSFRNVIEIWEGRITRRIERFIKANGYAELSDEQFNLYVQRKIKDLSTMTREWFNEIYYLDDIIDTGELFKAMKNDKQAADRIFREMFHQLRDIAVDIKSRLEQLDAERAKISAKFEV